MKGRARMILLGCSCFAFNLSEAIAERNAFNCECERHDLLARKMQGHDVCFAAVTRLRTFIKAIECAAVVYGGHEQRR